MRFRSHEFVKSLRHEATPTMDLSRPIGGMFGIKLVGAVQPEFSFFGKDGNPALMNFPDSAEGQRIARLIPVGHKSLVYLMHPIKRFWSAIEYIKWDPNTDDVLKEGMNAAKATQAFKLMKEYSPHYSKIWRCIRVLASINDPIQAPTPEFGFHEGDVMFEIEQREYLEMYNAIPWTWTADMPGI